LIRRPRDADQPAGHNSLPRRSWCTEEQSVLAAETRRPTIAASTV
jgi:hypothetical protein